MDKVSSNNIIASSKAITHETEGIRRRLGRVSIVEENLRNLSYIQPSLGRRDDGTVDESRTEIEVRRR